MGASPSQVPAGAKYEEQSLGRVLTSPFARGTGLGKELLQRALQIVPEKNVRIGAQQYLEKFYG